MCARHLTSCAPDLKQGSNSFCSVGLGPGSNENAHKYSHSWSMTPVNPSWLLATITPHTKSCHASQCLATPHHSTPCSPRHASPYYASPCHTTQHLTTPCLATSHHDTSHCDYCVTIKRHLSDYFFLFVHFLSVLLFETGSLCVAQNSLCRPR